MSKSEAVAEKKDAEVVPIAKTFSISKEDRLEGQNIQLKRRLLDVQASQLLAEQRAWEANLAQRLGVPLEQLAGYHINLDNGEVTKGN